MEREVAEHELVAAAKSGDRDAFGELVQRHARRMVHITRTITKNLEDAEDAVQDCFVNALAHLASFDGRSRFSTWLTRIAINAALMRIRKNRGFREVAIDEPELAPLFEVRDSAPDPEESYGNRERCRILREAILELQPKLRAPVGHHLKEASIQETAEMLGISVGAAKARLFQAKAALRRAPRIKILGSRN